jgi:hypothetical protein
MEESHKLTKENILERHKEAVKYIISKREPDADIINKILLFKSGIEDIHIDLCIIIYNNRITLDLPRSHEESVIPFSKVADVEYMESLKKSRKFVPGCYRIWGLGYPGEYCYIGQTKHLGRRVKYHSKGSNNTTKAFCSELGNNAKVDLFIIPKDNEIIKKYSIDKFLCVLEQFLFFKYRPLVNKLYIVIPGVILDQKAIKKHREKVGKKIYIYLKSKELNRLELIYISSTRSYISKLLGYERSWIKNILVRSFGWYKDKLYFSSNCLESLLVDGKKYTVIHKIKNENIIKKYLEEVLKKVVLVGKRGYRVKVTNTKTDEIIFYRSKREAARHLKADPSSISNRSKLFRNIYKIEIIF